MIRLQDVAKEYTRTRVALSHVTFQVKRGEFVFLIGPSGSGKTSILRLLYMEEKPTHGDVWVNGIHSNTAKRNEIAHLRRKLGIVFQEFRLLDDRTAEQNVAFALEVTGASRAEIRRRVPQLLNLVGLHEHDEHLPTQLSGGEQQRVAIARALVHDPAMLIADEPTGNLDPVTSWEIIQLLIQINGLGTTVLMATHNQEIVNAMRRRVLALEHGTLVRDESGAAYEREY